MRRPHEIKLDRFHNHFDDTVRAVADYLTPKPYVFTEEKDEERLRITWTITLGKVIPPDVAGVVGDAIHNLRSALDNWVYEFSRGPKGETKSKTGFPILTHEADWDEGGCCRHDHGSNRIRGLPDPLKALVKDYQPFMTEPAWMDHIREKLRILHKLDIRDKHQRLNVVTANVELPWWSHSDDMGEQTLRYFFRGLLEPYTPTPFLVLDFASLKDFEMGVYPDAALEVVVAEKETQGWERPGWEVISFLDGLYTAVSWILGSATQILQPPVIPGEPSPE